MSECARKKNLFSLFILIILISAGAAAGRTNSKVFSIVPFVGIHAGYEFGQFIPLPNTADVPNISVLLKNRGILTGFNLSYLITEHFEFMCVFHYNKAEIINENGIGLAGFPLGKVKISDVKVFGFSGNLLYHIPVKRHSLYLTGGLGAVTLSPTELKTSTQMMINFGGGVKYNFTNQVHLFLDVRNYFSFFNYAEDFDVAYAAIYTPDFRKSQNSLGIHLGLGYSF